MNNIILLEEYRLIEKKEKNIGKFWKGSHLILFFFSFVFGSICTYCFHMLMYMFDEKCILFPKLMSLTSVKPSIMYEFISNPEDNNSEQLQVDFLSTRWVEKSACYLPTYVPLVSSIFGLLWTAMFIICNTGNRVLAGFHRPWWVLPFVLVFSLVMGCLCVYSSVVTHKGLNELCQKLNEITGNPTCTYTVNVVTLVFEKSIRGVYQTILVTIVSAWLHTSCWLLSAMLILARILLIVDFQLVKIKVEIKGNLEKMLDKYEKQISSVIPENVQKNKNDLIKSNLNNSHTKLYYRNMKYKTKDQFTQTNSGSIHMISKEFFSSTELIKLNKNKDNVTLPKNIRIVKNILKEIIVSLPIPDNDGSETKVILPPKANKNKSVDRLRKITYTETKKKTKDKVRNKNIEDTEQTVSEDLPTSTKSIRSQSPNTSEKEDSLESKKSKPRYVMKSIPKKKGRILLSKKKKD